MRHQQGTAFMADRLARVDRHARRPPRDERPGATILLTGVATAHVVTGPCRPCGGIVSEHSDKDTFEEFDLVSMFRPVTQMAVKVTRVDRIPMLHAAVLLAMTGRRGGFSVPPRRADERLPAAATSEPGRYRATDAPPPTPRPSAGRALVRHAERPSAAGRRRRELGQPADAVVRLSTRARSDDHRLSRNDAGSSHRSTSAPWAPACRGGRRVPGRIPARRRLALGRSRRTSTIAISGWLPIVQMDVTAAVSGGTAAGCGRHRGRRARGLHRLVRSTRT